MRSRKIMSRFRLLGGLIILLTALAPAHAQSSSSEQKPGEGQYVEVDERLHQPIDQALAIIKASGKQDLARRFADFVVGDEGQAILRRYGYSNPSTK